MTSKLVEGDYQNVCDFVSDCRLVCENCFAFYRDNNDGAAFVEQARRLQDAMAQKLGALVRYDQENRGNPSASSNNFDFDQLKSKFRTKKELLFSILKELRDVTYTDRFTKVKTVNVYFKFTHIPQI